MSQVIYEPKGRAREYSPLALNLYMGCTHCCKYCYAPSALQRKRESYFISPPPRKNVVTNLERQLKKSVPSEQVLLSFVGDVYCQTQDDNSLTAEILEILLFYKVPTAILTKGGKRALKHVSLLKKFGKLIHVGATLTFNNDVDSLEYESGAALPHERLDMLKELNSQNITTFVSFEPVIAPEQSLDLIEKTLKYVDIYKIGKINNFQGLDKKIDWTDFLDRAVNILRKNHKRFYIKHDLRLAAPSIELRAEEIIADDFTVKV